MNLSYKLPNFKVHEAAPYSERPCAMNIADVARNDAAPLSWYACGDLIAARKHLKAFRAAQTCLWDLAKER